MQCTRTTARSACACAAPNAFNPAQALRAAFATTSRCPQEEKEPTRTHRPLISRNVASVYSKDDTESMGHEEYFRRAVYEVRRESRRLAFKGERILKDDWPRHLRLLREIAVRLSRGGKTVLSRMEEEERITLMEGLDYKQKIVMPRRSDVLPPIPFPWSISKAHRAHSKSGRRVLGMELEEFAKYMELTPMERVARQAVVDEILAFAKQSLPHRTGVEVFGSVKTGLATPLSDIDIRIFDMLDSRAEPYKLHSRMDWLRGDLKRSCKYGVVFLRHGRYPIINCQHMESGIQIQIVASNSAEPQAEAMTKYIEAIPNLRRLLPVIRTFFDMRGFCDVYSGGISSYGQFVMLVAAILRCSHSKPNPTMADHLIRFLTFYDGFDSSTRGIAIGPRRQIFRKHDRNSYLKPFAAAAKRRGDPVRAGQWSICERREFEPHLLCIQDPATPDNDLGRRSSAAKHIIETIRNVRHKLRRIMNDPERFRTEDSVLEPVVGRCHEVYYRRRERMEEYGLKITKEATERQMAVKPEVVKEVEAKEGGTKDAGREVAAAEGEQEVSASEPDESQPATRRYAPVVEAS